MPVLGAVLRGLDAVPVEVQVAIAGGSASYTLVGLAGSAVKESKERVHSAIRAAGLKYPRSRLTINLAPAEVRKDGGGLDLALAVAILLAGARRAAPPRTAFMAELALDGTVRHANGVLVAAGMLHARGVERLYVAAADVAEAALVGGLEVHGVGHLGALAAHLLEGTELDPVEAPPQPPPAPAPDATVDLGEVHGQEAARRALEVAAAGGHHLLMLGAPGSGKTMLARCLPGILPPLEPGEALEVARISSILGELEPGRPLATGRPFRAPHHSVSLAGLVGGGSGIARPGEITRAHHGVLFLDEVAEFEPRALQALRQPLEGGRVTVTRSGGTVTYPARFQLVAAGNPCPCGWSGDQTRLCRCRPAAVEGYRRALSGPLLDRIDLQVDVERPPLRALSGLPAGETSAAVRERVGRARRRQLERQGRLNADLDARRLREGGRTGPPAREALEKWATARGLTARGFMRAWRVAGTVADLDDRDQIEPEDVLEALSYRLRADAA